MRRFTLALFVILLFFGCKTNEPLPQKRCITDEELIKREFLELKRAKEELLIFKNEYASLSSYILFLNNFGVDYSKYQSALSGLSSALSYIPIPYAGQISSVANFGVKITALASDTSKELTALNGALAEFEAILSKCEGQISREGVDRATIFAQKTLLVKLQAASRSLKELKRGAQTMLLVADITKKQLDTAASSFGKLMGQKGDNAVQYDALKSKNDSFERRIESLTAAFERAIIDIQNAAFVSKLRYES